MKKTLYLVILFLLAAAASGICYPHILFGMPGARFALTRVAPRVFTPEESSTVINRVRFYFDNPDSNEVTIRIYDITGALVRRTLDREDENVLYWDGTDRDGAMVKGGIYVYQLEAGSKILSGTVVVAR